MRIAQVAKLLPQERFLYWIKERHAIYLRRKSGKPRPWTDDEILLTYKFCNPVRINDRTSQWLLKNWYEPFKDHINMLLACSIARQLNNPESLAAIGFPSHWDPVGIQKKLESRMNSGLKNYSAAYIITSNYGAKGRESQTKAFQTVWTVCDPIARSGLSVETKSMESTWKMLLQFQGFSSFIAGQVVADLRWGLSGSWLDRNSWAPAGPGSLRGLNRYHGRDILYKISQLEFLSELLDVFGRIKSVKGMPVLEAMDCQSCLCEFDKYERVLNREGRPKVLYNGRP